MLRSVKFYHASNICSEDRAVCCTSTLNSRNLSGMLRDSLLMQIFYAFSIL